MSTPFVYWFILACHLVTGVGVVVSLVMLLLIARELRKQVELKRKIAGMK
jgi:hypothetical protein